MSDRSPVWAVVAGGGTAGHVLPALAIGEELVARGVPASAVHYLGSERGLEARLFPASGFPHTLLPGRGIQRRLALANIGAVIGLVRAVFAAVVLVRRLRPAVVVGLGGYASAPGVLAAIVWRVPLVIVEQNSVPGAVNRLGGRFAAATAVTFEETDLPRSTVTGNPVRPEVLAVDRSRDRDAARRRLGVEGDRRLVAVFGGSLGARRINEGILAAATVWRSRDDLAIRHIAGRRDHADLASRLPVDDLDLLQYDLIEYEDDMPTVLAAADVVLCRAGATSVVEVAAVGVPSILVPLPGAPGDHQTANARSLERVGGAVLVADDELDGARIVDEVDRLLADPGGLDAMGKAAASVARRDAAEALVELISDHARRPYPTEPTPSEEDPAP